MTEKFSHPQSTLLLAFIAGLSISGAFTALFSSILPFTIFPFIALVLAVYCLHVRYQHSAMPEGLPTLTAASFLLGLLFYSAVVRAEYPQIGSNFFPSVLSAILVVWISVKVKACKPSNA